MDCPQLELDRDNSLTNFLGCWLMYRAYIPRVKLTDRFGVNLRINFFVGVRLAETEQLLLSCGA